MTLAVTAVASLAGVFAQASGATTFMQPARHGEFREHRLTLHGVGRSVSWKSRGPGKRSGVVSFQLLKRRLFSHNAALTARLHVAGRGRAARLLISRPRYNARRGTVSYRVKRLNKTPIPRRFGRASLSIVMGAPVVGGSYGDHSCQTQLQDDTAFGLQPIDSSKGELDTWALLSPPGAVIGGNDTASWESDGALFKGCSDSVVWKFVPDPNNPHPPPAPSGTVSLTTTYPWDGLPSYGCTSSYPAVSCKQIYATKTGVVDWVLVSP